MASTSSAHDSESQTSTIPSSESVNTVEEDDFQPTIEFLGIDAEELLDEISQSVEELEGLKQYPCEYCAKVCKSKAGRTKHTRSKHDKYDVEAGKVKGTKAGASKKGKKQIPSYATEEKILSLIREIGKSLTDEKIYPTEQVAAVFSLRPSKSFIENVNALLHKFHRKKDRDKLMQEYYGKMYASWKEYFHPCTDQKVVFLMLVNLPERLIILTEDGSQVTSEDGGELSVTPSELGPLAYVAGYVIQALYRKSKNSKNANSQRNQEIQVLLLSMKVPAEENEYISSLSRGALWAPNSWLVGIAEIAELCFRKHTRTGKSSSLPVDKVVEDVQASPLAKSLWNNVVEQCDVKVTKECRSLCFENIVKLYATVRGFSYAKDIVNKYKLSEKTQKKKALRKQLKADSEPL